MTVTTFNRLLCVKLGDEIAAAVRDLAAKHGLTVHADGGTFSDTEWTARLKFKVQSTGTPTGREADRFREVATMLGFEPTDLGRHFEIPLPGGARLNRYRILGLSGSRHYKVVVERDGKAYTLPYGTVLKALGKETA